MGNEFDDAADEAAAETDEQLSAKLAEFGPMSFEKLSEILPDASEREAVQDIIMKVGALTKAEDRKRAIAGFLGGASVLAIRAFRKVATGI